MRITKSLTLAISLLAAGSITTSAQDSELEQLKNTMKSMEQQMEQMKQKIADLERAKAVAPTPAGTNTLEASSKSIQTLEKVAAGEQVSQKSPVTYRETLNDQQEAAS